MLKAYKKISYDFIEKFREFSIVSWSQTFYFKMCEVLRLCTFNILAFFVPVFKNVFELDIKSDL